jgi:type IV secretory pathway TraG/TraD family ATPase VirD4
VTAAAPVPQHLLHGTPGLLSVYLLVTAATVVGCAVARAPFKRYLAAPVMGAIVLLVGGMLWSLLAKALPSWLANFAGILLFAGFGYAVGRYIPPPGSFRLQRGTVIEPDNPKPRSRNSPTSSQDLAIAGVAIPLQDETKHFKFIGTTGTGKSTAIREILFSVLARGDRAVIADPDAGYLSTFHDAARGDVILNPFESRSLKWDLFAEIREPYDFQQLARSLIPEGAGDQQIWHQYARTFLAAVLSQAHRCGIRETTELYRLLASAPLDELRILLEGTPAGPFVQGGNERMFGSIRSVTAHAVSALEFINRQHSVLFSVRRWVQEGRGVLFLPYGADQIAALRSIISTWMRIAIFETMTKPEGDAHLWFIVDELDAVGQIDGLKDALARLRKFGGRCVLGFQSIAQVSATYSPAEADTIVENCANTLILRCSASEGGGTARFASKLIGEREVIHDSHSHTRRPTEWLATATTSEHRVTESAVLPSEIEQLPDLHGDLKIASPPQWRRVALRASPRHNLGLTTSAAKSIASPPEI